MKKENIFKKAFTLLEMLVVIGIIAIIIGIGAASFSTAQKKARDAKRAGDLHAMQNFMEQCFSSQTPSAYPVISGTGAIAANCPNGTSLTITDPLNTGSYQYSVNPSPSSTTAYAIFSTLETSAVQISVTNSQ